MPTPQGDGRLRCEIVAHARWLSALSLHPSRDLLASVAEDGSFAVWHLPLALTQHDYCGTSGTSGGPKGSTAAGAEAAAPAPALSGSVLGAALTGVAFAGDGGADVAAVGYDCEELLVWRGVAGAGGGADV
jgi:hypothetical protein